MKTTNVGLAETRVSINPSEVLTAMGLGSCVAVVMYDATAQVGGLTHIMLPKGMASDGLPGKFADTAVPHLLHEMIDRGATTEGLRLALFGGATMLHTGQSSLLDIGPRNVAAVEQALKAAALEATVKDTGGTKGRTVLLSIADGELVVKVLGEDDRLFEAWAEPSEMSR
jgi:chemotaxis protein CheD